MAGFSFALFGTFVFMLFISVESLTDTDWTNKITKSQNSVRIKTLDRVCSKYSNPYRSEHLALWGNELSAKSFGTEVVYLYGNSNTTSPISSVCIPHKVGSHSWGQFSKLITDATSKDLVTFFNGLTFEEKVRHVAVKVVVVRHPMERIISVYRMIFEDWCDQSRFLAKQWGNVCQSTNKQLTQSSKLKIDNQLSLSKFFANLLDEHLHSNDRYMSAIWHHFHPNEELTNPKEQLKFTFNQFVHFLVNGSSELGSEITQHKGLSYHWAPYWKECHHLCAKRTRPDFVVKLETLNEDIAKLLSILNLDDKVDLFPHTHSQAGGHSSTLAQKYFSQLTVDQVKELFNLYRLDHELFGYDIQPYLNYAKQNLN